MKITILATLLVFLAYFLLLYGAVGFIQDKRFFASASQENLAAIPDHKERFRGAHALGWVIEGLAVLLFLGAAVLAVWDGVRNQFGFGAFFARFFVHALCHGGLRYRVLRLCAALPLEFLSPLLPRAQRRGRPAHVRL